MDAMDRSLLNHIEAVVGTARATISADDDDIVAIVEATISSGKAATFYLSSKQANSVRSRYFTPQRLNASKIELISIEEKARIESELGIENIASFRSSRKQCECGQVYGAFEFLQQGIREHGADVVKAVFALNNFTILNANRPLVLICPNCNQVVRGGFEYDCDDYGGCCYEDPQ